MGGLVQLEVGIHLSTAHKPLHVLSGKFPKQSPIINVLQLNCALTFCEKTGENAASTTTLNTAAKRSGFDSNCLCVVDI